MFQEKLFVLREREIFVEPEGEEFFIHQRKRLLLQSLFFTFEVANCFFYTGS